MISVFEVFAINRNEDDFLENLDLFKQLVMEQQENGTEITGFEEQKEDEEEVKQWPKMQYLQQFRGELTEEEYQWCRKGVKDEMKNILNIIECWVILKDSNDLIHSLKQLYKRVNKKQ